jgi:hypothetical protein
MPMTFPAHQGLILPVVRRWPNSFDALALSVGAAMPDITDSILSFPSNGYFKQWYGHALIGIFTFDLAGGLFITWLISVLAKRLLKLVHIPQRFQPVFTKVLPSVDSVGSNHTTLHGRNRLRLWSFSVFVGILSHIGFDLISHDTNILLYPWYENVHWFPDWWYKIWFTIPPLHRFGRAYSVGVFSVIWELLTLVGIFLFIQFLRPKYPDKN